MSKKMYSLFISLILLNQLENIGEKLNTQFKISDTQYVLLLRINTHFHKNLICFSVSYKLRIKGTDVIIIGYSFMLIES